VVDRPPYITTLMKSRSALKAGRSVLFLVLAFAIRVFADDLPKFSDQDVNTYVKSWSSFNRGFVAATANWETVDRSTLLALESRAQELATQTAGVVLKVHPDETEKFTRYMTLCFKNFDDFTDRLKKSMSQVTGAQENDGK
jgi:hypothetical protein